MNGLNAKQHVLFALRHAKYLPTPYQPEDANRMTLGYFCLSSLALLPDPTTISSDEGNPPSRAISTMLTPKQTQGFIDWIYQQQLPSGGFKGSDSLDGLGIERANIIQSYTALLNLAILDDGLQRLDRVGMVRFLAECQERDGSFSLFPGSTEPGDPRSTYSAFVIASILNDWSSIDVEKGLQFLDSCRRYEGGFAQRPGLEANAGPTYCAIASYSLSSRFSSLPLQPLLLRWLVDRQVPSVPPPFSSQHSSSSSSSSEDSGDDAPELDYDRIAGFQGRTNKPPDACYSFWTLASLKLLAPDRLEELVDISKSNEWLLASQHPVYGGIAREPTSTPDVYHTYLSLAALALSNEDGWGGLGGLDPEWNVEKSVRRRWEGRIEALNKEKAREIREAEEK